MFVYSQLADKIRLPASTLRQSYDDALLHVLNAKYANKVVLGLGLVITVCTILSSDDPWLHAGDSAYHAQVTFRVILFRPSIGDILVARVRSSDAHGLKLSLGFFDDIYVPIEALKTDMVFDAHEGLWTWQYGDHSLYVEKGDTVRVRLLAERFREVRAVNKETLKAAVTAANAPPSEPVTKEEEAPFVLTCGMDEDGLGVLHWWD